MRDKLEKTGHKKAYYRARIALVSILAALGILSIGAIPVGITYSVALAAHAKGADSSQRQEESAAKESAPEMRLVLPTSL